MPTIPQEIAESTETLTSCTDIVDKFVHGPATIYIPVRGGTLRPLLYWQGYFQDKVVELAGPYVQQAEDSATAAAGSASTAQGAASTATTKAGEASDSATAAAGSASTAQGAASTATTKAGEASDSATAASGSASTATTKAGEASDSATAAAGSASTAQAAASTATTKAGEASDSATAASGSASTATTKAGEASDSATAAADSASTAQSAASTATTKATEASNSATQAGQSATAAGDAQTAAETARDKSQAWAEGTEPEAGKKSAREWAEEAQSFGDPNAFDITADQTTDSRRLDQWAAQAKANEEGLSSLVAGGNFTAMPTINGDPVVESGSNSDGAWTRWADGTQQIRKKNFNMGLPGYTGSGTFDDPYMTDGQSLNYPVPFVSSGPEHFSGTVNNAQASAMSVEQRVGVLTCYHIDIANQAAVCRWVTLANTVASGTDVLIDFEASGPYK
ncbi:hypothetical protein [Chromohalobacter israelensis]|uniref:hypothetical protein n=1 Tax=Chromohalobacter israelensis TaxID=141390 RepID=UPI00265B7504|nr:hypothetical protein [Chromohalobacter salexigens]MDO0945909.1 hypothetical protein [Chromohalobacter salexigens]